MISLSRQIKSKAIDLGFSAAGISSAEILQEAEKNLKLWLAKGMQGSMDWMTATSEERANPKAFFKEAKSVLMIAQNYFRPEEPSQSPTGSGTISLYARGRDYHKVVRKKLKNLLGWILSVEPSAKGRIFTDSFPVMEKPLAVRAGIGWIGKNSTLILKNKGSYFFLGGILLNLPLPPDKPFEKNFCGSCNRCLHACPTGALFASGKIDARRCISYLTIEHRGKIGAGYQEKIGNHIFGCDICQDVCPWNRFAQKTNESDFFSRFSKTDLKLSFLESLSRQQFEQMFEGTAVRRAGFDRFLQNVRIAKNNYEQPD